MPGSFIIKPIEANLTHNTDLIGKMNPYCSFLVGNNRIKGQICKKGGKHPHWNDAVTVPATTESQVLVEVMDKDKITHDDNIGSFILDLHEVQSSGQVSRWYPLTYKNKAAGEILMEVVFQPDVMSSHDHFYQERLHNTHPIDGLIQKEEIITTTTAVEPTIIQEQVAADLSKHAHTHSHAHAHDHGHGHGHVWTEQRQVVEPHTFVKEVEVVETRPALKEIEVMEPVKVIKDVEFTQAVPVKKQIEVMEPQVVIKEIEVIEPQLVSKTIQVVENVPVIKQIEVVEMRNAIQEVETVEPQTFTKQVEVTEYVPVKKQVEVTQPVTLKKAVEFVEPVITTQTITKEIQQPVIVSEEITTTVGPATVVGMSQEYGYIAYEEMSVMERERLAGHKRWIGFEKLFGGLTEEERLFEQQRLSRMSEEEWMMEQGRLIGLSEEARLAEQRRLFGLFKKGHFNKHHHNHHHHHHHHHGHTENF